jgi:AAA+ superfamily predicted ATPase
MSFSNVAISAFFPLHRDHQPALVTPAGVAPVDGLLTGPVALAAALMDAAGATIDSLSKGVHIVFADDLLEKGVKQVVNAAVAPTKPMWLTSRFDDESLIEAIQFGALLIGVAEVEGSLPDGLHAIADGRWRLPDVERSHVADAIRLMTGTRAVALPDVTYVLKSVLLALKPGHSATRIAADLARLHPPVAPPAPPPAPVAQEDDVVGDAATAALTRLRDLTGYGDARAWGLQLAEDLQSYRDGDLAWDDVVEKGLLLSGPPGCGKTYYAAALAAECDAKLIVTGYSQWHGASSGDSVQKGLTKLFADVRKAATIGPVILFVDEIDSIGKRGTSVNGDYWYGPIINSWLAFLDGAEPREGIVVIAATNRPDQVDEAMLRPGRLEKHIRIPHPSIGDLEGVLEHHLGFFDGIDAAARDCRGLSPADVAQIAREARRSARRLRRDVTAADVADIVSDRRGARDPAFDRLVCVHECGHALVALRVGLGVEFVDADGCVTSMELPSNSPSLARIEDGIAAMLGGRAAELVLFGHASSGAIDDLGKATALAAKALQCGLAGSLISLPDSLVFTLAAERQKVEALLSAAMDRATAIVSDNRAALDALVAELAEKRYLDAEDLRSVAGSE